MNEQTFRIERKESASTQISPARMSWSDNHNAIRTEGSRAPDEDDLGDVTHALATRHAGVKLGDDGVERGDANAPSNKNEGPGVCQEM